MHVGIWLLQLQHTVTLYIKFVTVPVKVNNVSTNYTELYFCYYLFSKCSITFLYIADKSPFMSVLLKRFWCIRNQRFYALRWLILCRPTCLHKLPICNNTHECDSLYEGKACTIHTCIQLVYTCALKVHMCETCMTRVLHWVVTVV